MGIYLELVNVAFCVLFLVWLVIDILRRRDINSDAHSRKFGGFDLVNVLSSVLISILYLGFGFHEYWSHGRISIACKNSTFNGMTWVLGTLILVYSKKRNKTLVDDDKKCPWVLILWWVYSTIFGSLCVSLYLMNHFKSMDMVPVYALEVKIVDFASLPLSIALCFSALCSGMSYNGKKQNVLELPLIEEEEKEEEKDFSTFASAGLWSHLVFGWLNRVFETGRTQKLELIHIPPVPHSETAENGSLLLEESLLKQKLGASSLPKGVTSAIWKSLAANAIFAGVLMRWDWEQLEEILKLGRDGGRVVHGNLTAASSSISYSHESGDPFSGSVCKSSPFWSKLVPVGSSVTEEVGQVCSALAVAGTPLVGSSARGRRSGCWGPSRLPRDPDRRWTQGRGPCPRRSRGVVSRGGEMGRRQAAAGSARVSSRVSQDQVGHGPIGGLSDLGRWQFGMDRASFFVGMRAHGGQGQIQSGSISGRTGTRIRPEALPDPSQPRVHSGRFSDPIRDTTQSGGDSFAAEDEESEGSRSDGTSFSAAGGKHPRLEK